MSSSMSRVHHKGIESRQSSMSILDTLTSRTTEQLDQNKFQVLRIYKTADIGGCQTHSTAFLMNSVSEQKKIVDVVAH